VSIDKKKSWKQKPVAWVAICTACLGVEEGLRTVAYKDPVGIPTFCIGETFNKKAGRPVRIGDAATKEECEEMLVDRVVNDFGAGVDGCLKDPDALPPQRKAAYTSLAYNIGVDAFCRSTAARKHNAGDVRGSCDAILLFNKAGGIVWPGLVKRREKERGMCLEGMS
jgi:lysozyme